MVNRWSVAALAGPIGQNRTAPRSGRKRRETNPDRGKQTTVTTLASTNRDWRMKLLKSIHPCLKTHETPEGEAAHPWCPVCVLFYGGKRAVTAIGTKCGKTVTQHRIASASAFYQKSSRSREAFFKPFRFYYVRVDVCYYFSVNMALRSDKKSISLPVESYSLASIGLHSLLSRSCVVNHRVSFPGTRLREGLIMCEPHTLW